MTLKNFFSWALPLLQNAGIDNTKQELFWLLEEIAHFRKQDLFIHPEKEISDEHLSILENAVHKRKNRYPLQYILKQTYFMDLIFEVGPGVLIPRPETELLAKWAIDHLPPEASFLELGVGSGCISISSAYHRPDLFITAVDISESALSFSRLNAKNILPEKNRLTIQYSDLFSHIDKRFTAIISNPPYLSADDLNSVEPELQFEPALALSPGSDGLSIYKSIAENACDFLVPHGFIALEIGYNIYKEVMNLFKNFKHHNTLLDHSGIPRVLIFQKL